MLERNVRLAAARMLLFRRARRRGHRRHRGHCVKSTGDLDHIRFVFGFRTVDGDTARTTFSDDDVYPRHQSDRAQVDGGSHRLGARPPRSSCGRPQTRRFRSTGRVKNREPVFVIGHPCGLPQKIARGARLATTSRPRIVANLDTYSQTQVRRSSAPGAINSKDCWFEVRRTSSTGTCNVSMVFPTTGAGGEDVARATEWKKAISKSSETRLAVTTRTRKRPSKVRKVAGKRTAKRKR